MSSGLVVPDHLKNDPGFAAELAELEAHFEANPLERYNHPLLPKRHEKQMEFHAIHPGPMGTKLLLASNRSGKTVCGVVDDLIQLLAPEMLPAHLAPFQRWAGPIVVWVGAPKNENHFNNTIPLFRKFTPRSALIEGKWRKSFKSQPNQRLVLANGSEVAFKTYDQDLDAWAGAEVHIIHWDEEPNGQNSRELRTEARYRLVSTEGYETISMTPVLGAYSWVNDEVWERRDEPRIFALKMRIDDNPWNSPEVVEQVIAEAKAEGEEVYRTRILAEFVHLGGLFFEEFDRDKHVRGPITPDHLDGQEIVVAIDPGRDRTGVVWLSFDGENRGLVFDEFFPARPTVPQVAEEIFKRNKAWGLKEEPTYVIDPSARNENVINADKVEAAFIREGIYAEWGQNNRAAGILEVKRRLQTDPASLLFAENCAETIRQAERYARDPKAADEWKAVPQTSKVRWDLIDGVRYGVMSRTYYGPDDEAPKRTAFQPDFQPPYREEWTPDPLPPMGKYT